MKEISYDDFNENVFNTIGKDWLLLTAQKEGKVNTMTASGKDGRATTNTPEINFNAS